MTGTLAQVGLGRWAVRDVADALAAADRTRCGPVAPAEGLYLTEVSYGEGAGSREPGAGSSMPVAGGLAAGLAS